MPARPYIGGTPGLRVHQRRQHGAQVVTAVGVLSEDTVPWLQDCLLRTLEPDDPDPILDLRAVTRVDSHSIEELRRSGSRATALGGRLRAVVADPQVHRRLHHAGLTAVVAVHVHLDDALVARRAGTDLPPGPVPPHPRRPGPVAPTVRPL